MQQFWREFVSPSRVPECWIRQGFEQPARTEAILVVVERRLHAGQPPPAFRLHRRTGGTRIRVSARCALANQLVQRLADFGPPGMDFSAGNAVDAMHASPRIQSGRRCLFCNVVSMIRHCRPCNFNQPLRKQLYVGNQTGGSDDFVEHRDPVTAPTEPGSAMSDGLTAGQLTKSGIGRTWTTGPGGARVQSSSDCRGRRYRCGSRNP